MTHNTRLCNHHVVHSWLAARPRLEALDPFLPQLQANIADSCIPLLALLPSFDYLLSGLHAFMSQAFLLFGFASVKRLC